MTGRSLTLKHVKIIIIKYRNNRPQKGCEIVDMIEIQGARFNYCYFYLDIYIYLHCIISRLILEIRGILRLIIVCC